VYRFIVHLPTIPKVPHPWKTIAFATLVIANGRLGHNAHAGSNQEVTRCLQEEACKTEMEALKETISSTAAEATGRWARRVTGFSVVNKDGQCVGIQRIGIENCDKCFITGELVDPHPALVTCPSPIDAGTSVRLCAPKGSLNIPALHFAELT
jgi:hypothetical protein